MINQIYRIVIQTSVNRISTTSVKQSEPPPVRKLVTWNQILQCNCYCMLKKVGVLNVCSCEIWNDLVFAGNSLVSGQRRAISNRVCQLRSFRGRPQRSFQSDFNLFLIAYRLPLSMLNAMKYEGTEVVSARSSC